MSRKPACTKDQDSLWLWDDPLNVVAPMLSGSEAKVLHCMVRHTGYESRVMVPQTVMARDAGMALCDFNAAVWSLVRKGIVRKREKVGRMQVFAVRKSVLHKLRELKPAGQ